jgi:hypothetical protein
MKLVLELVAQIILKNPDQDGAMKTMKIILENVMSVVIGRSTKPVAKSALKSLDHFLSKGVTTLDDIKATFLALRTELSVQGEVEVWRNLTLDLFHWMRLHFICPTAGKLIVSVYRLWRRGRVTGAIPSIETWHQWLLDFLVEEPTLLESIKNYIFLPLFKVDRSEALQFLRRMNEDQAVYGTTELDLDFPALLQLAALETGKKVGLVEEPGELPEPLFYFLSTWQTDKCF